MPFDLPSAPGVICTECKHHGPQPAGHHSNPDCIYARANMAVPGNEGAANMATFATLVMPDTLKVVRDRSVTAFKERLGFFATDEAVWQYRDEVDRLMRVAYEKGRIDGR